MEYYADSSSLLISIFWILAVIFAYYDKLKANHSISKKLFYFEGIKENKFKELKELKDYLEEKNKPNDIDGGNNSTVSESVEPNSKNQINNEKLRRNNTDEPMNTKGKKNKKNKFIDFSTYNILEMLLSFKFCICKTKKLKLKVDLIRQARKVIKDKLDIVYYIRNMIKLELTNKLKPENKEIFDFLSRPIFYLNQSKQRKKSKTDNDSNITNNTNVNKERKNHKRNKEQKKIIDSNEINLKESNYLKDEIYKSAYKLNTDELTESINI